MASILATYYDPMITIGCTIFFNKCQEVDTVLNTVFLGVPNPISEDIVKEMVDKVLQKLEKEQFRYTA